MYKRDDQGQNRQTYEDRGRPLGSYDFTDPQSSHSNKGFEEYPIAGPVNQGRHIEDYPVEVPAPISRNKDVQEQPVESPISRHREDRHR